MRDKSPGGILYEAGFYDDGAHGSLDGFLTDQENDASRVIDKLRQNVSLASLDPFEQKTLALFTALQYCRSPRIRTWLEHLAIGKALSAEGPLFPDGPSWFAKEYPGLTPKQVQFHWLASFSFDIARYLFTTLWCIVKVPSADLVTSDHPVILSHRGTPREHSLVGRILYLPISPSLVVLFEDRSLARKHEHPANYGGINTQLWLGNASLDSDGSASINRSVAKMAVRYVISPTGDFRFVEKCSE